MMYGFMPFNIMSRMTEYVTIISNGAERGYWYYLQIARWQKDHTSSMEIGHDWTVKAPSNQRKWDILTAKRQP